MTYVNGVGPQVVGGYQVQEKLPLNQPVGGKIIAPPSQKPQGPVVPNTPLAGLISPPKLPPKGPYIPAPIAGLINPPNLPKLPYPTRPLAGLIAPPTTLPPKNPTQPLGGLIAPPKNPAQKPEMPPEKILEAIKDLLEAAKNNNQAA